VDKTKPISPLNPWIAFIGCLFALGIVQIILTINCLPRLIRFILLAFIPWLPSFTILAANYHVMGKKKKRNIFIGTWILVFFLGWGIMGLIVRYFQLRSIIDVIFYSGTLMMILLFTLIQLPDYKKWQEKPVKENLVIKKVEKKRICPLNPWAAFILCFLIPWLLPGTILAANYHMMGKKIERNIFIIVWCLIYFVGSAVMGLTCGHLHLGNISNIFYIWSLIITLLFTIIQLPDYKKWQEKLKEGFDPEKERIKKIDLEIKDGSLARKIKLFYITNWFILLMFLVVFPLFFYALLEGKLKENSGGFTSFQWSLSFLFMLFGVIFIWREIKKYVIQSNTFSLITILWIGGVFPGGVGFLAIISLIISNFTIWGISSESLLWIVILIFGAISIYGLLEAKKLVNQMLDSRLQWLQKVNKINKEDEKDV